MDIFGVLSLIGGLAIFLYGMDLLGEGLTGASGGKLEKILEKLTSSPVKAVLLGAGVTAVIQSSPLPPAFAHCSRASRRPWARRPFPAAVAYAVR